MSGSDALSPQDVSSIQQKFSDLRRQEYQLTQKISELDNERAEHDLVLSSISKMDGSRKCFHLVGGVLVESKIEGVIPDVQFNRDRLITVITQLQKTLSAKTAEINALQKQYGASAGSVSERGDSDAASGGRSSKGVLVG